MRNAEGIHGANRGFARWIVASQAFVLDRALATEFERMLVESAPAIARPKLEDWDRFYGQFDEAQRPKGLAAELRAPVKPPPVCLT